MGWSNFFEGWAGRRGCGLAGLRLAGLGCVAAGQTGLRGCWLDWVVQAGWLWAGLHRLEWGRIAGAVLHTTQALAWLHGAGRGCVAAGLRGQEQGLLVVGLRGCWTDWAAWLLSGLHTAQGCTGLCLAARCRAGLLVGGCRGVGCWWWLLGFGLLLRQFGGC
ncbi:hypothetical protein Acr_05g0010020 [Actinidia rufa]|uniref:Uncharacterized protein n=1 Tax=Actinidia rufa TaxID=165716 RepID=A0A7J0ELM7_9ERIC|nr:hypothetical protein Acr_05g0010020 [Actinidia rufa]